MYKIKFYKNNSSKYSPRYIQYKYKQHKWSFPPIKREKCSICKKILIYTQTKILKIRPNCFMRTLKCQKTIHISFSFSIFLCYWLIFTIWSMITIWMDSVLHMILLTMPSLVILRHLRFFTIRIEGIPPKKCLFCNFLNLLGLTSWASPRLVC